MERATEIASVLRQLAIGEEDRELADALLEAVARVERFADYKLRNQAQSVIGETHTTLQDRIDSLFNVARDTHQLVFSVQQEQHTQGDALVEVRATFQAWAEQLSGLQATVAEHDTAIEQHDAAIQSFYLSRDESRQRHDTNAQGQADLAKQNRALAKQNRAMAKQLRTLTAFMERIEARIADSPMMEPEEAAAAIAFVRRAMAREAGGDAGR